MCVELHLFTGERLPRLDPYLRTNKRKIGLTALRDEREEREEEGVTQERNERRGGQSCVIEFTFVWKRGLRAV